MLRKILYYGILMICLTKSKSENDFFIISKYYNKDYFCVTNTTYALSWTTTRVHEKLEQESTFIPKRNNNSFDCRIENDFRTNKYFIKAPWELKNSLETNINEVILDQRWEEMKIFKTEYVIRKGTPFKFTTVLSTLKSNFDISFSIRTENEAHIFLCDGEDPYESNCYWFMLQAFSGNETAIRKCSKKTIPKINNEWPQGECKIKQANIVHPDFPRFLKSTHWTHLKLTKRAETLTLVQKNKSRKIIEFSDKQELINVTHMVIHSKMVNALWKIHKVEFIYTKEETHRVQLGPTFSPTEDYICVSMYLLMCDYCKVKLTLLDTSNGEVIEQDFDQLVPSEWREIKFISESKRYQNNTFKLFVSTIDGTRDQRFWAIDRVRLCQKKEFRMIGLSEKAACQLMSDNNKIITVKDSVEVSESECPENTIGEFCVPCKWIYKNCEQIKICDNDKCVCSSGYDIWNQDCVFGCEGRRYGHGCKKFCGNCNYSECNNIDGTCSPCTDGFSGPKCDIKVKEFTTNCQEISLENIEIKSTNITALVSLKTPIGKTFPEVTIFPNTRGVNITLSSNCNSTGGLKVKTTVICNNEWCRNQNKGPKTTHLYVLDDIITIDGLTPFSDYSLDLIFRSNDWNWDSNTKRETFRTKPTIPNAVTDLLVYTKNESSASLRWKPPYPPNGVLQKYKIEYSNSYIQEFEIMTCKLWPDFHCVTVSDLERRVEYRFKVNAKNEDIAEFGSGIVVKTETEIEPSREPYDLNITWTINNDLILQWKHPNESNGPIQYFNIILNSETNKVEKNLLITNDIYLLNYNFKIDSAEVFPSTRYIVQVSAFNGFPGHYVYLPDTSPPDIPLLNGDPGSNSTKDTITLKISLQKPRGETDNRRLYILISDKNNSRDSHKFEKFGLKNFQIAVNCTLGPSQDSLKVTVGNVYQFDNCYQINNLALDPATFYNITMLLLYTFGNKSSHNIYAFMYKTLELDRPVHFQKSLFGLLFLVLLIPVIGYVYIKKQNILKSRENASRRDNTSLLQAGEAENAAASNTEPKNQNGETSRSADIYSKKVKAEHFLNYVKACMQIQELEKEHQMILNSFAKNTYETLHRGPLEYVDVQFANGRLIEKAYVTSTVPERNEIDSFWKTIWNENIYNIVLFDTCHINDLKTFANYWPDFNQEVHCCDISVCCLFEETFATYQHRRFIIHYENLTRQIDQLQFSLQSNQDVQFLSLNYAEFFKKMSQIPLGCNSPILVHSSSGMHGNTFALLCDICLRRSKKDGVVDVLGNLQELTEYNTNFVIDCDHYVLTHLVILENLLGVDTSINCNSLDMSRTHLFTADETEMHLKHLKETLWMDAVTRRVGRDSNVYFRPVPPLQEAKVFLEASYNLDEENSPCWDRLGAISVDGFRCPNKFLVIPQPTSNTLSDIWDLVVEKNISVILSLNEITPSSSVSQSSALQNVPFVPGNNKSKVSLNTSVEPKLTRDFGNYEWTTLELSSTTKQQTVEILSMKTWSAKTSCPPDVSDFVNFCIAANDRMKGSGSVMVTCCDGVTASGLFTAMSYNMQEMKTNGMCDVCTSVRTVRRHCPQFVNDKKQYTFLVEAAHRYINECKLYEVR